MATRQSTKGNTAAVSGETLNSIFQEETGRAREEGGMAGDVVDPQAAQSQAWEGFNLTLNMSLSCLFPTATKGV